MIFQHTLDAVLNGTKTQTSRIWKPSYRVGNSEISFTKETSQNGFGRFYALWKVSEQTQRKLYQVNNTYAVQPNRGKVAVARIRITRMEKMDVTDFTDDDIQREGFSSYDDFIRLWQQMHDDKTEALVIRFELVELKGMKILF